MTTVFRGSYDDKGRRRVNAHCSETHSKRSGSKKTSIDSGTVQRGLYRYHYGDYDYNYTCGYIEADPREGSDEKVEAANQAADESAEKARDCAQKARCVAKAAATAAAALDALRLKQEHEVALKGIDSLKLGERVQVKCNVRCSDPAWKLGDVEIVWVSAFVCTMGLVEGRVKFDVAITEWAHLDKDDKDYAAPYYANFSYDLHGDSRWRRGNGMVSPADLLATVVADGPYIPNGFVFVHPHPVLAQKDCV